jgi:site-specific DNA recombinase
VAKPREKNGKTARTATAIRRLVNKITVTPTEAGEAGTDIKIDGLLGLLVDQGQFSSSLGGLMVAEEGFEPPTQGL